MKLNEHRRHQIFVHPLFSFKAAHLHLHSFNGGLFDWINISISSHNHLPWVICIPQNVTPKVLQVGLLTVLGIAANVATIPFSLQLVHKQSQSKWMHFKTPNLKTKYSVLKNHYCMMSLLPTFVFIISKQLINNITSVLNSQSDRYTLKFIIWGGGWEQMTHTLL